ncbi:F-box protein [Cinnamomum micranthum f. kanehirae]|uniref:F-box protein n=1 Tax=Cinnamomum micranthum f. kanehirae TaxID=337451 RepID=A0A443NTH4_9MAGN|nr:F-box protein [Cinnamomum micranthum f. kanehirae]
MSSSSSSSSSFSSEPDLVFCDGSEPSTASVDHFDRLPDSLLLLVFNKIGDVKALGRFCVVSRRFHGLVPQVDNVVVKVDCVISDDDSPASNSSDKMKSVISHFFRLVLSGVVKPLQALGQFLGSKPKSLSLDDAHAAAVPGSDGADVSHHSPTEVLKNFNEIRTLRIELPGGELGIDDGVLLKWKAEFGSTLDSCVILGASSILSSASSVLSSGSKPSIGREDGNCGAAEDNGSIPDSFYTDGEWKLRVLWTISSLIVASARHYLLQQIIAEHETLESLVLTDSDGQGVLRMNRGQLEELRVKPLTAAASGNRTLVPAVIMRLWYAPHLELPDGAVLKGATLVAIRPSEQMAKREASSDGNSWVSAAFEEPFTTAAKQLVKRRPYFLEMNSF